MKKPMFDEDANLRKNSLGVTIPEYPPANPIAGFICTFARKIRQTLRVLYISYDGMTDPLGRSQVMPYLFGLARHGHRISILSFEKPARYNSDGKAVGEFLEKGNIDWHPLPYTASPPVISTLRDLRKGRKLARSIHQKEAFDLIHCRSYIAALIGDRFRRKFGIPFLFDMRGFWADERVEGGLWKLGNPIFRTVYNYFKKKERVFFSQSAHVVSLTEAGKKEIVRMSLPGVSAEKITVIPCCTDMDLFRPFADKQQVNEKRKALGIPENAPVLSYLGSFGTWYMAGEMLDLFGTYLRSAPAAVFLLITQEAPQQVIALAEAHHVPASAIRIVAASREEVPCLLALSDHTIFFIRPSFSKKASSPTKMGEALSMGIPVICNDGIGDCTDILTHIHGGHIIPDFTQGSYDNAVKALLNNSGPNAAHIREGARAYFDLEEGIRRYAAIYTNIGKHENR
jgi:glycosyltransferase involved in cell wall biosynthesis